jgi:hypothetical protein
VTGVEDADATPMVLNGQNSYGNVAQQEKQGWQRGSMTIITTNLNCKFLQLPVKQRKEL